jgi:hypothetical protein
MNARERERERELEREGEEGKKIKEKQKGMCRCLRDEYRRREADKDKKKARGPESSGAGAWGDCSLRCAPSYPLSSLSFSSLAPSLARVRDVLCCLRPSAVVASDARPPLQ